MNSVINFVAFFGSSRGNKWVRSFKDLNCMFWFVFFIFSIDSLGNALELLTCIIKQGIDRLLMFFHM